MCRAVRAVWMLGEQGSGERRRGLKTIQVFLDLQWGYLPVNPWLVENIMR